MSSLLLAIQFLTAIPVKNAKNLRHADFANSLVFFPLTGALIGILTASVCMLLDNLMFHNISSILTIVCWITITAALHLDGLADTFDALGSGKDKSAMLEIMRDSRIGTFGTIALIIAVILKLTALSSLQGTKIPALIISPIIGRFSLLWPLIIFRYARQEGKAKMFFESASRKKVIVASLITLLLCALIMRVDGIIILAATWAASLSIAAFLNKKFSGLTGDNLGTLVEISEILALVSCTVLS